MLPVEVLLIGVGHHEILGKTVIGLRARCTGRYSHWREPRVGKHDTQRAMREASTPVTAAAAPAAVRQPRSEAH